MTEQREELRERILFIRIFIQEKNGNKSGNMEIERRVEKHKCRDRETDIRYVKIHIHISTSYIYIYTCISEQSRVSYCLRQGKRNKNK